MRKGARGSLRADAAARRADGRQCGGGRALRRYRGHAGRERSAVLWHGGGGGTARPRMKPSKWWLFMGLKAILPPVALDVAVTPRAKAPDSNIAFCGTAEAVP